VKALFGLFRAPWRQHGSVLPTRAERPDHDAMDVNEHGVPQREL
jgi:hypothetical protein